jgi:hypothetical protein
MLALVAAGCFRVRARTDGVVLNSRDRSPIRAAQVTAECRRSNAFHGSHVVKTLQTSTDEQGIFRFNRWDLARCDFMFVKAARSGYAMTDTVDIRYGYTAYEEIPGEVFLTPVEALGIQRLEFEFAMSGGTVTRGGKPYPEGAYQSVFTAFYCSEKIAKSPEERRYVREHYCERLKSMAAALTPAARASLPTLPPEECRAGGALYRAVVTPMTVDEFCAGP